MPLMRECDPNYSITATQTSNLQVVISKPSNQACIILLASYSQLTAETQCEGSNVPAIVSHLVVEIWTSSGK